MTDTAGRILDIARDLLGEAGPSALSFDAIAARLGKSKQAVLYWYPTKQALLAALFLPALRAEADAVCRALDHPQKGGAGSAVRALCRFHLSDLDRFRLMYLSPQILPPAGRRAAEPALLPQVHEVTDGMYAAISRALAGGAPTEATRREAAALHATSLGLVLMYSLADSLDDPLKHDTEDLIDILVARWERV